MPNSTLSTTTVERREAGDPLYARAEPRDTANMPLAAALLAVAAKGLSFATPGHRCGRSCSADR
jgi:hypothetical protein